MAEIHQDRTGTSHPDVAALPAIDEASYRRGVCDFCYRESAIAAIATVHQATRCGWAIHACRRCINDDGETGRRVQYLRLEDAAQTRLLQEIHDQRRAETGEGTPDG